MACENEEAYLAEALNRIKQAIKYLPLNQAKES